MRLAGIGVSSASAPRVYAMIRALAAISLALLALVGGGYVSAIASHQMLRILIFAAGGVVGWFLPPAVVQRMVARRLKHVVAGLPDALELLVVCAEAGFALEEGIERVAKELKRSQPDLAEELALTSADLKILPDRDAALSRLAERIDQDNFRAVITTLTQTMRYGTPLAQALRAVASEMRSDSLIRLEERANRLPALLTVPMMLFIMPTIFLIIGGPAFLRLMDIFFH
jgi:tight adherence protein C